MRAPILFLRLTVTDESPLYEGIEGLSDGSEEKSFSDFVAGATQVRLNDRREIGELCAYAPFRLSIVPQTLRSQDRMLSRAWSHT